MKKLFCQEEKQQKIYDMYYTDLMTQKEIASYFKVHITTIENLMKRMGWKGRTMIENYDVGKVIPGGNLKKWKEANPKWAWTKGLTKNDPKLRASIEKSKITKKMRGVSYKGKNNPMYGKTPSHIKAGYRKDLKHFVRSSWEASFARILILNGLDYEYEKYTFSLKDGDNYTPDFYVPSKKLFYEIKGWETNNRHSRFKKEYPNLRLKIVREEQYNKYISKFGHLILIDDNQEMYRKDDIERLFIDYVKKYDGEISIDKFISNIHISARTIKSLYGSFKQFKLLFNDTIKEIYKIKCLKYYEMFKVEEGRYPNHKQFMLYNPSIPYMLGKCFGGKTKNLVLCKNTPN
jgi:hypothetical protein